jgi:hypothetical protein
VIPVLVGGGRMPGTKELPNAMCSGPEPGRGKAADLMRKSDAWNRVCEQISRGSKLDFYIDKGLLNQITKVFARPKRRLCCL